MAKRRPVERGRPVIDCSNDIIRTQIRATELAVRSSCLKFPTHVQTNLCGSEWTWRSPTNRQTLRQILTVFTLVSKWISRALLIAVEGVHHENAVMNGGWWIDDGWMDDGWMYMGGWWTDGEWRFQAAVFVMMLKLVQHNQLLFLLPLTPSGVHQIFNTLTIMLEPIPAVVGREAGHSLDRLPDSRRANTERQPIIHTVSPMGNLKQINVAPLYPELC